MQQGARHQGQHSHSFSGAHGGIRQSHRDFAVFRAHVEREIRNASPFAWLADAQSRISDAAKRTARGTTLPCEPKRRHAGCVEGVEHMAGFRQRSIKARWRDARDVPPPLRGGWLPERDDTILWREPNCSFGRNRDSINFQSIGRLRMGGSHRLIQPETSRGASWAFFFNWPK